MSDSKFKIEFTLKQHTPIIHFQSDQKGATLRATELKPKLDRFLKSKLKIVDNQLYEKYKEIIEDEAIFPPDGIGSSAYAISIKYNGKAIIETPKAYVNSRKETDKSVYQAPYFSDNLTVFTDEKIDVSIKSFNTELLELISKTIDYIFIFENFGTRQSKGFGSFLREDISANDINKILSNHQNKIFSLGSYGNYKKAFLTIDSFYKKLKMGINKPYKKSLLFQYMCTENIGWEKKFLKNKFPQIIHGTHTPVVCKEPDDREFKYIRAVLGLAEHNEFRPNGVEKQVKIESVDRDENDPKKARYQRFKSPITFKVFNRSIYLIFDKSYEAILNKEFYFKLDRQKEKLFTPKEFDMYEFLKFVEKETGLKEVKV